MFACVCASVCFLYVCVCMERSDEKRAFRGVSVLCVCVCMYECMHAFMHVCAVTYVLVRVCVHMCVCVCALC